MYGSLPCVTQTASHVVACISYAVDLAALTYAQGAVKISCARQDPNARNCHGYRKFVKRSVLESPQNGYMANDTIVIRYTIELVVSSGGALSGHKAPGNLVKPSVIQVGRCYAPCMYIYHMDCGVPCDQVYIVGHIFSVRRLNNVSHI